MSNLFRFRIVYNDREVSRVGKSFDEVLNLHVVENSNIRLMFIENVYTGEVLSNTLYNN